MALNFDHIVIGAGIEGSACAWQLARRGLKTLLIEQSVKENGQFEVMSSEQFQKRFPEYTFPSNYVFIFEPRGGLLLSDKCLQAIQNQFHKVGGTLHETEKMLEIVPYDAAVSVVTNRATYTTKSVVLCMGPWAPKFLQSNFGLQLPMKALSVETYFRQITQKGVYAADKGFPTMNMITEDDKYFYAWPSYEYPDMIKETEDNTFVLDHVPNFPNVVIGCGFSGHGFKHAPAVGEILADLAQGKEPEIDRNIFRVNRFPPRFKASL